MKLRAARRPRFSSASAARESSALPGRPDLPRLGPFHGPRGALPTLPRDFQQRGGGQNGMGWGEGEDDTTPRKRRGHAWHNPPHFPPPIHAAHPGWAGMRRGTPGSGRAARKWLFKNCPPAGSGERRGAGTGRRRGPTGRAWGSGSGRGSPLRSYVCQEAADAAARDKVKGERRGRGQT